MSVNLATVLELLTKKLSVNNLSYQNSSQ